MSDDGLDIEKRWMLLARMDPEAFFRFYDKYVDRIYRYCLSRTLDPEAARDLTSETFLRAQGSLGRFRWQGVTFGAYLYRIAENVVRQRARDLRRETGLDDGDHIVDPRINPLAQVVLTESQQLVREALARLDDRTREIMLLHYWENLTVREIAVVLDMNESTVKARLRRGRGKLLAWLPKEGGPPPDAGGRPGRDDDGREDEP